MKRTLYINAEANKILETKENMSRYVSDLIISDYKHDNVPTSNETLLALISALLKEKPLRNDFTSNDDCMSESINDMLKI